MSARRVKPRTVDVAAVMRTVTAAAAPFESRWTLRALQRTDVGLHQRLVEQMDLYHEALVTGSDDDVEEHSAAMQRGWAAATRAMEAAGAEDDAYLIGRHLSGVVVAIGDNRHAVARVRTVHGDQVVWVTPDEVAALIAGLETIKALKGLWPGAEIIRLYPTEPAAEEG